MMVVSRDRERPRLTPVSPPRGWAEGPAWHLREPRQGQGPGAQHKATATGKAGHAEPGATGETGTVPTVVGVLGRILGEGGHSSPGRLWLKRGLQTSTLTWETSQWPWGCGREDSGQPRVAAEERRAPLLRVPPLWGPCHIPGRLLSGSGDPSARQPCPPPPPGAGE